LYTSPKIITVIKSRRIKLAEHVARMVQMRNACKILVGKREDKRPVGRPRCRQEVIITTLREIGWEVVGGLAASGSG
jgi:hypothetical protein